MQTPRDMRQRSLPDLGEEAISERASLEVLSAGRSDTIHATIRRSLLKTLWHIGLQFENSMVVEQPHAPQRRLLVSAKPLRQLSQRDKTVSVGPTK